MNKFLPLLFLMTISCKPSLKKEKADYSIPARLVIECIDSVDSDEYKPDTSFRKIVTKDSIEFTTESVENCCHWYAGLKVGKMSDTIKIIDTRADGKHFACDCICLFKIAMEFEKHFFDTTNSTILFWEGKKLK